MGGKSTKKQTQSATETSAPPAWAMPLFSQGAQEAQRLYNSGQGGNAYQGRRVADLGAQTQSGLSGLSAAAQGFGQSGLAQGLGQPTAAQSNLADMASGAYLSQGNPYYRDRLNEAVGEMSAKVNSQMSGAGRYGSGANADILAKNAANMMLSGLDSDYNRAVQNMIGANAQIDNAKTNAQDSAGAYLRNWSDAAQAQMLGGKLADANEQAKLSAAQNKWEEEDNSGWKRLGLLADAAQGFAGSYGTKTSKNTAKITGRQSPWETAGALSGLTRKSDMRAKENISPVGCKNGFPLYAFSYRSGYGESGCGRGAAKAGKRFIGVLAQDILRLKPAAVRVDADGLYSVDYAQLGFDMRPA